MLSTLATRKRCALWHAFRSLDRTHSGEVGASQLKVLTYNVLTTLGKLTIDCQIEKYATDGKANYEDFISYVDIHVFKKLTSEEHASLQTDKIDELCWMLCQNYYCRRRSVKLSDNGEVESDKQPDDGTFTLPNNLTLTSNHQYQLWRVFNIAAEVTDKDDLVIPVVAHKEEVLLVMEKFVDMTAVAVGNLSSLECCRESGKEYYAFKDYLVLFRDICASLCECGLENTMLTAVVQDIYDEYVEGVLKKGFLYKKSGKLSTWSQRYMIVRPGIINLYISANQKEAKCTILTTSSKCEILNNKLGAKTHLYRFVITTDNQVLEFSVNDAKTRLDWMKAIKTSIQYSNEEIYAAPDKTIIVSAKLRERYYTRQRMLAQRHREDELRNNERDNMSKAQQQLLAEQQRLLQTEQKFEEEKRARLEVEEQLKLESEQLKQKQQQLQEKEEMSERLEKLLVEERQAKEDEEMVRAVQARILQEEFERREELERLQLELSLNLEEERKLRDEQERIHQEQLELMRKKEESLQHQRSIEQSELKTHLSELERQQEELVIKEKFLRDELLVQRKLREEEVERQKRDLEKLMAEKSRADTLLQEATDKWQDAEQAKHKLSEEMKNKALPYRKLFTTAERDSFRIITHRGVGAFTKADFTAGSGRSKSSESEGGEDDEKEQQSPTTDIATNNNEDDDTHDKYEDEKGKDNNDDNANDINTNASSDAAVRREMTVGGYQLTIDTDEVEL